MNLDAYDKPRPVRAKRAARKRILIVTEGAVTEPEYFKRLREYIELKSNQLEVRIECGPDKDGNTPSRIVSSAKELRDEAKKRQDTQDKLGSLESREEFDEVWVVFDTERDGKNIDLKTAAEHAKAEKLKVAISRPSFESWFLLHLRDGLPAMAACDAACKEISRITKSKHGREYHKDSKNNADLLWLIQTILPFTKEAITRSTRIETVAFAAHELVPSQSGTKVHKLVKTLWDASPRGAQESTRIVAPTRKQKSK